MNRLVHPQLYESVGIPGEVGHAAALANPVFRETLRWSGQPRGRPIFTDLGLIEGPGRLLWRRSRLL